MATIELTYKGKTYATEIENIYTLEFLANLTYEQLTKLEKECAESYLTARRYPRPRSWTIKRHVSWLADKKQRWNELLDELISREETRN